MNFNRPQSQHLSCVFLSPKVMNLNHLRVLRRFVLVAWRKSEWQREGRIDGCWEREGCAGIKEMVAGGMFMCNKLGGRERERRWPWLQNESLLDVNTCATPKQHMHKHTGTSWMRFWLFSWLPCSQTSSSNCNLYWQMAMSSKVQATKEEKRVTEEEEMGCLGWLGMPAVLFRRSVFTCTYDTHTWAHAHIHRSTHTHPCTSIYVRIFILIIFFPAPYPHYSN